MGRLQCIETCFRGFLRKRNHGIRRPVSSHHRVATKKPLEFLPYERLPASLARVVDVQEDAAAVATLPVVHTCRSGRGVGSRFETAVTASGSGGKNCSSGSAAARPEGHDSEACGVSSSFGTAA